MVNSKKPAGIIPTFNGNVSTVETD